MEYAIERIIDVMYFLIGLLPESPIARWLDSYCNGDGSVVQILHYVNYFIPIGAMLEIIGAWISIMTLLWLYYTLSRKS